MNWRSTFPYRQGIGIAAISRELAAIHRS